MHKREIRKMSSQKPIITWLIILSAVLASIQSFAIGNTGQIRDGAVSPTAATANSIFTYTVIWQDSDGLWPCGQSVSTTGTTKVVISGDGSQTCSEVEVDRPESLPEQFPTMFYTSHGTLAVSRVFNPDNPDTDLFDHERGFIQINENEQKYTINLGTPITGSLDQPIPNKVNIEYRLPGYIIVETVKPYTHPEGGTVFYLGHTPIERFFGISVNGGPLVIGSVDNNYGIVRLSANIPSTAICKAYYVLGPILLELEHGRPIVRPGTDDIYMAGRYFCLGYVEGNPAIGAKFRVRVSAGQNLANDPGALPGVNYAQGHVGRPAPHYSRDIRRKFETYIPDGPAGASKEVKKIDYNDSLRTTVYDSRSLGEGVMELIQPDSATQITVPRTPVQSVRAVYLNDPFLGPTGINYFDPEGGATFNTDTGVLNLSTALPITNEPVWVLYSPSDNPYDPTFRSRYGGVGNGLDQITLPTFGDPLVPEFYPPDKTDQLKPYDDQYPEDGASSTAFIFRATYLNSGNLFPRSWLPSSASPYSSNESGVVLYLDTKNSGDYQPYFMRRITPAALGNPSSGVQYWFRVEPTNAFSVYGDESDGSYWSSNNHYVALPPGRYHYFIGTSDDSLLDEDGNRYPNLRAIVLPELYTYRHNTARNYWTELHNPPYYPDSRLDTNQDGVRETVIYNNYIAVDRPTYVPGIDDSYQFSGRFHPIVRPTLRGVDGPPFTGGGLFLGTLEPYYRMSSPIFSYPCHGASASIPRSHCHTGIFERGIETSGATTKQTLTFRVVYQSMDPDTGLGKAPVWIKVFINDASDAGKAGRDDGRGIYPPNPSDPHFYRSYNMTPAPGQVINPTTLAQGIIYQVQLNLPPGPHTYFFEAYDGFMYTHFPVRPDGRFVFKENDSGKGMWYEDAHVPGDEDTADNNDYIPGPYINTPCVLVNPTVTPSSGPQGTTFEFSVTYRDADGQRPYRAQVLFDTGYGIVTLNAKKKDPSQGTQEHYRNGIVYVATTASLENLVIKPGLRQYKFQFTDDWGRQSDPNDQVMGETVTFPASGWIQGPLIIDSPRPDLLDGNVQSADGSATSITEWTYRVTYRHASNTPPAYVKVYIGDRGNGPTVYTLQRNKRIDQTKVQVQFKPIVSVTGVFVNPDGTGTNYYTGGSFNATTGVITLGTPLPAANPSLENDVYVTYSAETITWDAGHDMVKRDAGDNLYTDGAVYVYTTKLPGAEVGQPVRRFLFAFEASDGNNMATYDPLRSPSAYAVVGTPEPYTDVNENGVFDSEDTFVDTNGNGIRDAGGELLTPVEGSSNTLYSFANKPLAGPLPITGGLEQNVVPDPIIYRNGYPLVKNAYRQVVIAPLPDRITINIAQGGLTPSDIIKITSVRGSTLQTRDIEYYDTLTNPGQYIASTGQIILSSPIPAGVNAVVTYIHKGDYDLDYFNGIVIFNSPQNPNDVITSDYWFAQLGQTVGANTPPTLTNGSLIPTDGALGTTFTFSVTYTDVDGPRGQAPQYVRLYVDGTQFYEMTYAGTGQPNYRNGALYRYSLSNLTPGNHSYRFEASDGEGFAVLDANGSRNSSQPIANVRDFTGPYVGVPLLTSGEAKPNPVGGTIDSNQPVTYSVVYYNFNNDPPDTGNPVVWIDNPSEMAYISLVSELSSMNGTVLRDNTQEWPVNGLIGRFIQFVDGLAKGKVYLIKSNTANTLQVENPDNPAETADLYVAGVRAGDRYRIGGLEMKRRYELQVGDYTPTVVALNVGDSLTQLRTSITTITGVIAVYTTDPPVYPAVNYFEGGTYDYDKRTGIGTIILGRALPPGTTRAYVHTGIGYEVTVPRLLPGNHTFHFKSTTTTTQGGRPFTQEARFPRLAGLDGEIQGPFVVEPPAGNSAPVLTSSETGGVMPSHGKSTDSFTFSVYYSDSDNDPPTVRDSLNGYIRLRIDLESGGTQTYALTPAAGPPANHIMPVLYSVVVPTLPGGTHRFHFEASDGYRSVRLPQFPVNDLRVKVNNPPALSIEGINPLSPLTGNPGVEFRYRVIYSDLDGNPPDFVRLVVDGTQTFDMTATTTSPNYRAGVIYEKTLPSGALPVGPHTFAFLAKDFDTGSPSFDGETVQIGPFDGPIVTTSGEPVLSQGEVIPEFGGESTEFNFRVLYTDPDNDAPQYVKVFIDDVEYSAQPAGGTSFLTGVYYSYKTNLAAGTDHRFRFEASDWAHVVKFPADGSEITGKPVVSFKPVLSNGTVTPSTGFAGDTFTFRVTYRDPDGVPPAAEIGYVRGRIEGLPEPLELAPFGDPPYDYASGVVYQGTRTLPAGLAPLYQHRFFFEASDGYDAVRLDPSPNILTVYEGRAELRNGTLSPLTGTATSTFTYSVYYFDPNNQAPRAVYVYVDGVRRTMSKVDPSDNNYRDGALYQYSTRLTTAGTYTYRFEADTAAFGIISLPSTGELTGPTVTTSSLTLAFDKETANVGDTVTVFIELLPRRATTINLKVIKPNLQIQSFDLATDSFGQATVNLALDVAGDWRFNAYWPGASGLDPAEATARLTVGAPLLRVEAGKVQMIAIPLRPLFGGIEGLLGAEVANALGIARWDPITSAYIFYETGRPFPNFIGGEGFWIKPRQTVIIQPRGQLPPQTQPFSVPVNEGWNQVGHCFFTSGNETVKWSDVSFSTGGQTYTMAQAAELGLIRDYAWMWDTAKSAYVMIHASRPNAERSIPTWQGIWVRAFVSGNLIFAPPTGGEIIPPPPPAGVKAGIQSFDEDPVYDMPPPVRFK